MTAIAKTKVSVQLLLPEGFRPGYEDAYYSRLIIRNYYNGEYSVLGSGSGRF